jgi:hypothetical protein
MITGCLIGKIYLQRRTSASEIRHKVGLAPYHVNAEKQMDHKDPSAFPDSL